MAIRKWAWALVLMVLSMAGPTMAASPKISALGWLAGSWTSTQTDGALGEQTWLPPRAGTMVGVFRLTRNGKVELTELLTVREEDYGLVLTIRRLGGDLKPLPDDKGGLSEFTSTKQSDTGTIFESKDAKLGRVTWRKSSKGMEVQVIPRGSAKPVLFSYTRQ